MLRISAGVALFALVVSLLAGSQRATEAITWVMVASIVVAALWGRWRYGNSPRLQRWDATWASVERALPGNPEEADRLVAERQREDDRERDALRVRAATDLGAAREFLRARSEEHTSELQSQSNLVCRLLLEKKKKPHGKERSLIGSIAPGRSASRRAAVSCRSRVRGSHFSSRAA